MVAIATELMPGIVRAPSCGQVHRRNHGAETRDARGSPGDVLGQRREPACRPTGQATDAACDFAHPPLAPALPTDAITDTPTGTSCGLVFTALSETANPLRFIGLSGGRFSRGVQVRQRVAVSRFAIAESELTVAQYREIMGIAPKCGTYLSPRACVDRDPVHSVTWREAIALANALTRRENARLPPDQQLCECHDEPTGRFDRACTGYRLPTQAEWDYAAGDVPDRICDHAWIDGCGRRRGNPDLHEVMTKLPSQFGLFDVHGNAREWVYDAYSRHESSEPAANPIDDGRRHTARRWRGSWVETNIDELDAAHDEAGGEGTREFLGLRLARGPLPQ